MRAIRVYDGTTGDFEGLAAAGFVMDKATSATFQAANGLTFQLITSNEPQTFDISITGILANTGTVIALG